MDRVNVEDVLERSQRRLSKVSAELAIMLVKRKISRVRLRDVTVILEAAYLDLRKLLGEEDGKDRKEQPGRQEPE